jgi:hypothetical protein
MRGDVIETAEEMPRLSSIRKKRKAHSWGSGIRPKAIGKIWANQRGRKRVEGIGSALEVSSKRE